MRAMPRIMHALSTDKLFGTELPTAKVFCRVCTEKMPKKHIACTGHAFQRTMKGLRILSFVAAVQTK
jgi:hypothetical protein